MTTTSLSATDTGGYYKIVDIWKTMKVKSNTI